MKTRLLFFGTRATRLFLGVVLLTAGLSKVIEYSSFSQVLSESFGLSIQAAGYGGLVVVSLELVLAFFLIFNLHPKHTAYLTTALFVALLVYSLRDVATGKSSGCGCFGSEIAGGMSAASHRAVNLAFVIFAVGLSIVSNSAAKETPQQ